MREKIKELMMLHQIKVEAENKIKLLDIDPKSVFEYISQISNTSLDNAYSARRHSNLVIIRKVTSIILRMKFTLEEIGRMMNRNHTSIINYSFKSDDRVTDEINKLMGEKKSFCSTKENLFYFEEFNEDFPDWFLEQLTGRGFKITQKRYDETVIMKEKGHPITIKNGDFLIRNFPIMVLSKPQFQKHFKF